MKETAYLVLAARRALTYSCITRYYLEGVEKQDFCTFLIRELTKKLELLTHYSEMRWEENLDKNQEG